MGDFEGMRIAAAGCPAAGPVGPDANGFYWCEEHGHEQTVPCPECSGTDKVTAHFDTSKHNEFGDEIWKERQGTKASLDEADTREIIEGLIEGLSTATESCSYAFNVWAEDRLQAGRTWLERRAEGVKPKCERCGYPRAGNGQVCETCVAEMNGSIPAAESEDTHDGECPGITPADCLDAIYEAAEVAQAGEAKKNHEVCTATALCLGFNELAKLGKSLGEKVYARLARDVHVKRFVELGGNADLFATEPGICTLVMPVPFPHVIFKATDIELMREAVAAHDAAALKGGKT